MAIMEGLRGKTTKKKKKPKSNAKIRQSSNGRRELTEKEKKALMKRRKKEQKMREKQTGRAKKRAKKRKKSHEKSEFEDQLGDGGMSEARLDRLAAEPDIWEKLAEDSLYDMLRTMGNNDQAITKFQKNRVIQAVFIAIVVAIIGAVMGQNMMLFGSVPVGFIIYKMKFSSIRGMYNQWKFERELAFSRFVRLLIPYLKQSEGNISLYTVFNKMLERMDDETDKNSLYMLMGEMSSRPGDIRPFYDFAERSSGSDMAYLIMSTIYDFQQSTQDTSVIDELGQMASDHMMSAIDEIIAMKIGRFGMFPTKIVLSSFILVVGFAAGVILENVMRIMNETGGMDALFGG